MIEDAVALGKNVGICRNFHKLEDLVTRAKLAVRNKQATKWHIDVWPLIMDVESDQECSYEMLLQLSNIVHQVHRYHQILQLRLVFFVEKVFLKVLSVCLLRDRRVLTFTLQIGRRFGT